MLHLITWTKCLYVTRLKELENNLGRWNKILSYKNKKQSTWARKEPIIFLINSKTQNSLLICRFNISNNSAVYTWAYSLACRSMLEMKGKLPRAILSSVFWKAQIMCMPKAWSERLKEIRSQTPSLAQLSAYAALYSFHHGLTLPCSTLGKKGPFVYNTLKVHPPSLYP